MNAIVSRIAPIVKQKPSGGAKMAVSPITPRVRTLVAEFRHDNEQLPLYVEIDCFFPATGSFSFAVYFAARTGDEALKGEQPFMMLGPEE
jgi:hypothetical protein